MTGATFLSSAPVVKKALLELFRDRLKTSAGEGNPVQIEFAHPGVVEIQQEAIYFGKTISHEHAAALGHRRRDEDYELELIIDVVVDGKDAEAAELRCWELVAAVELAVGESPGSNDAIGDKNDGWVVFNGTTMEPHILSAQRLAEATCLIGVHNRKNVTR